MTDRAIAIAVAIVFACAATAARADSCESLRAEIVERIRASGVATFSVVVVDATLDAPGQVVGSCGRGSRKIVYLKGVSTAGAAASAPGPAASAPPARAPAEAAVLTECKPGFVAIRGDCKKL